MRSNLIPALLGPVAAAAAVEPRALMAPTLASYDFNGQGCRQDSGTTLSSSASSVSITLPSFVAELRGADRRDFNVNCLTTLRMNDGVPGYRLAIRRVSGEGMFYGSPDVRLRVQASAYFQDYPTLSAVNEASFDASSNSSVLMSAPFEFDFEGPTEVFSQCIGDDRQVGNAFVNMRAILNWPEGSTTSYGAFLGTEASPVTETIEFQWVRCGDIDEPTQEEIDEGSESGGVVIGGEEDEAVVIGGEEGEAVVIGGEEGEAVVIGDEEGDEVVEEEESTEEDGE